ncbi:DUF3990 domain-containing protein [Candidatus Clostridium helianthi]|uniref:DUF3990 domain-containing protein n=1 Tax=Candidatus Clostridium helianthi TaxID=3381660 RepID=A0ABW8SBA1_9CLOT
MTKGFYCTEIKEQAELMAKRVARVYSGTSYVNIFELLENVNKLKQEMKVLYYSRVNYTALLIICKFNSAIFILLLEF